MKHRFVELFFGVGLIILFTLCSFISCTPPIHTGGSGSGTDDPYDLTTLEGFQRTLADDEYMQSLESTFKAAGVSEEFLYGDVNGDGTVDIGDALLTARFSVGITDAGFIHPDVADVDDNGLIDIVDALLIARYYVGLINSFPAEENLFSNGHFHAGDKDWGYFEQEGGSGSMEVADGKLKVTVDDGGNYLWSIGVAQLGFNLQEGKSYTFTCKAKTAASGTTELRAVFQLQEEPWTAYGAQNWILTQKMTEYSFTFTMPVTDSATGFNFHMGTPNSGDIFIDDVGLYENDNNLITNGRFDNGSENWDFQISNSAQGSIEVESGELKVCITDGGQWIWDLNCMQSGIHLKQSSSYIFSLKARKTSTEPLLIGIIIKDKQSQLPWEFGYDKVFFYLTEEMETHTCLLNMNDEDDTNVQCMICFGYVNRGDIYIDDISLYEVTDSTPMEEFSNSPSVAKLQPYCDVRGKDASEGTLNYEWTKTIWFNEDTVFNAEVEQNAAMILDKARNPGLGIRSLHAQGITGAGVNIAIIDQNLLRSYDYHPEYRENITAYHDVGTGASPDESSFHGPVVTSIAVGQTIGVAPGARVYYVASPSWYTDASYFVLALDWIIEQNSTLPDEEKIKIVSISADISDNADVVFENRDAWRTAVQRAGEAGILVVDDGDFIIADKGRCDIEDPDNINLFICNEDWRFNSALAAERIIFVPGGYRTLAEVDDDVGETRYSYFFFPWTAYSCTNPYVVGVLALGWQVNPDLTYQEILDYLFVSAYTNWQGYKVINPPAFIQMIQDNM